MWCSKTPASRSVQGDHADRVAVADVHEHGVVDAVGQRSVEGRRAGVGGEHRCAVGQSGRQSRRRAQARELRGDVRGPVEELREPSARDHGRLPERETQDAVRAVRAEAVVLHGDGDRVVVGVGAEQRQDGAQGARIEVAALQGHAAG